MQACRCGGGGFRKEICQVGEANVRRSDAFAKKKQDLVGSAGLQYQSMVVWLKREGRRSKTRMLRQPAGPAVDWTRQKRECRCGRKRVSVRLAKECRCGNRMQAVQQTTCAMATPVRLI